MCTPIALLCRLRGERNLRVVQIVGEFTPMESMIVSTRTVLTSRPKREKAIMTLPETRETCVECGMPLALRLLTAKGARNWTREQVQAIRNIAVRCADLTPARSCIPASYRIVKPRDGFSWRVIQLAVVDNAEYEEEQGTNGAGQGIQ
jgi:hypothetical protein